MLKLFFGLIFVITTVSSQNVVSRVYVKNHRDYMMEVIQETINQVEQREWCNLKLPDFSTNINQVVLQKVYNGTVTYKNGFVVSIQRLTVLQSSLNQIWSRVSDGTVRVEIRGQLRLESVAMGFDITAELSDGVHNYTGIYVHPVLQFDFSVFRNAHTHAMEVTVTATQPTSRNVLQIMPHDTASDALTTLFDVTKTAEGVAAWATDVFQPIALDVINHRVEFPGLCYNCPAT